MTDESNRSPSSPEGVDEIAAKLALVPADLPRPSIAGAVSGAAPKLLLVRYQGKYYAPGGTPPEVVAHWGGLRGLGAGTSRSGRWNRRPESAAI